MKSRSIMKLRLHTRLIPRAALCLSCCVIDGNGDIPAASVPAATMAG